MRTCVCGSMCLWVLLPSEDRRKQMESLELELQAAVNSLTLFLKAEPQNLSSPEPHPFRGSIVYYSLGGEWGAWKYRHWTNKTIPRDWPGLSEYLTAVKTFQVCSVCSVAGSHQELTQEVLKLRVCQGKDGLGYSGLSSIALITWGMERQGQHC